MTPTRKGDTSEYSSTEAPETQAHANEQEGNFADMRLIPGGARGSKFPVGMDGLDRDAVPSGAVDPGQTHYGDRLDEPDETK